MGFTTLGVVLMAVYVALTLLAPLVLSRPRLLVRHPQLGLRLWMASFTLAALSITFALGLFIALALRHHVVHVDGHDTVGPLIDQLLGWLAIAAIGILAFRMGVAVQDARTAVATMTGEFAPLLARASHITVGNRELWVVDSSVALMGARSGRVIATSAVIALLDETQLAAVVEHEHTHVAQHHARVLAIANIGEAIAPSMTAGQGFASAARITTELIADDVAAQRFGAGETARALELAYPLAPGVSERVARLRSRAS